MKRYKSFGETGFFNPTNNVTSLNNIQMQDVPSAYQQPPTGVVDTGPQPSMRAIRHLQHSSGYNHQPQPIQQQMYQVLQNKLILLFSSA